jgi:hypothetical protein
VREGKGIKAKKLDACVSIGSRKAKKDIPKESFLWLEKKEKK